MVQRAADESWDDLVRCPTCGGLNALDAEWCGQCNRRFRAAGRRSRTEPATDRASYVEALAGLLVGPEGVPEGGMERVFHLDGESSAWVCAGCAAENQLEATRCRQCGRPFAETVQAVVEQVGRENADLGERAAVETLGHVALAARAGPLALPLVGVAVLVALLKAAARLIARRSR
jgi:ribosomal protein L40E